MRVEKILSVSKEEFFNVLIDSLKADMKIKEVKEGMKFKKNLSSKVGKVVSSTITIKTIEKNTRYVVEVESLYGINTLDYLIEELEDEKIKIIYNETHITHSFFDRLNQMVMEIVFSFFLKRKKKRMFDEIELYILKKRKEK